MIRTLLTATLLLSACAGGDGGAPEAPAVDAEALPELATIAEWIGTQATLKGDHIALAFTGPTGDLSGQITVTAQPPLVRIEVGPLLELRDASGPRGVALLATTMAGKSFEARHGAPALDAAAGTVHHVARLHVPDGLTKDRFLTAFIGVVDEAYALKPQLRTAAELPPM